MASTRKSSRNSAPDAANRTKPASDTAKVTPTAVRPMAPSRANRREAAYLPTEAQVQTAIVEGLRWLGMEVIETGRWRKQAHCPHCGQWFTPIGSYGNTTGCPDIYFFDPTHPGRGWRALECKAPGGRSLLGTVPAGRIRPEQRRLADLGMTRIVYSFDDVLRVLAEGKHD